jgi:glycerol-3-phosphate dehydrogenase
MTKNLLLQQGMNYSDNKSFTPFRKAIPRFRDMSTSERQSIIKENPTFGNIICRCELVTEGEIVEAINRIPGMANLDAIKRRTRSGMGRCQGGFCSPKIARIISREMNIPMEEVTKSGGNSKLLHCKIKC